MPGFAKLIEEGMVVVPSLMSGDCDLLEAVEYPCFPMPEGALRWNWSADHSEVGTPSQLRVAPFLADHCMLFGRMKEHSVVISCVREKIAILMIRTASGSLCSALYFLDRVPMAVFRDPELLHRR